MVSEFLHPVVVTGVGVVSEADAINVATRVHRPSGKPMGRAETLAAMATRLAFMDAGFIRRHAVMSSWLVAVGTTLSGSQGDDRTAEPRMDSGSMAHAIADELELVTWQPLVLVGGTSAGSQAIGYGFDLIATNGVDRAICGGVDANSAAFVVLESKYGAQRRRAKIHAEIYGHGQTFDPSPLGSADEAERARCVQRAHARASVTADDVDLVVGYGTSVASALGVSTGVEEIQHHAIAERDEFVVQAHSFDSHGNSVMVLGTLRARRSQRS